MALSKEQKEQIVKKFKSGELDTGSVSVQVALLTARINDLTPHFVAHKKDFHGRRGLEHAVAQRRKLLKYLKNSDLKKYTALTKELGIRN